MTLVRKQIAAVGLCAALAGCGTTLTATPVTREQLSTGEPKSGVAYFLPRSKLDAKLSWTLTQCVAPTTGQPEVVLTPKVEFTTAYVRDDQAIILIDHTEFAGALLNTELKIETYDNGTLKSLNATAESRAAQAINSTLTAFGKILPKVLGAGATASAECTPQAIAQLAEIPKIKEKIQDLEFKIKVAPTDQEAARLQRLLERQKQRLTEQLSALTITKSLNDMLASKPALPHVKDEAVSRKAPAFARLIKADGAIKNDNLQLRFDRPKEDATPAPTPASNAGSTTHLTYRIPRSVEVQMCVSPCTSTKKDEPKKPGENDPIDRSELSLPEYGTMLTLPLRVPMFGNRSLSAAFRPDGSISTFGWVTKAPLESAASILPGAADVAAGAIPKATPANAELTAQRDQLKLEVEVRELESKLKALQAKEATDPPPAP